MDPSYIAFGIAFGLVLLLFIIGLAITCYQNYMNQQLKVSDVYIKYPELSYLIDDKHRYSML